MAKRVELDAMRGDHALEVPVAGATSVQAGSDPELVLVDDETRIRPPLQNRAYPCIVLDVGANERELHDSIVGAVGEWTSEPVPARRGGNQLLGGTP